MVTVIVVTYNSEACVQSCLASVEKHLPQSETVVVDNASTDTSPHLARDAGARVVELTQNEGFGRACNAGVAAATGKYILFVNPDVTLTSVDCKVLDSVLASRPTGLVAGSLLDVNGNPRPERDLPERSLFADYLEHTVLTLRPREWRGSRHLHRQSQSGWASAALLLAARDEFEGLGGFDPRFFLYYEDRDLCARYRAAGLPVRATNALVATHIGRGSSSGDSLRVEPMGWAFVSWLEYVHIHRGERSARHAASASWRTLQALDLGLAVSARFAPRDGRIARKRRQVTDLIAFIRERVTAGDAVSPDAQRALARVLG